MQMELEGNTKFNEYEEKIRNHQANGHNYQQDKLHQKKESDAQFLIAQNPLLMRNLLIIIDTTKSSKISDFKPSRLAVALQFLPAFIEQFLECNPLSQIGIAVAEEYKCKTILDFTSSCVNIKQYLSTIHSINEAGFSMAACLQTALHVFSTTQLHAQSSILFVTTSTYSDDKLDLNEWSEKCESAAIQINVISFAGAIHQLIKITQATDGQYLCPINEYQFSQEIQKFISPQESKNHKMITQLVKIGFPQKLIVSQPTLCQCHLEIVYNFYKCPVCYSKVCSPPLLCPICSTWIVLPHQILRSDGFNTLAVFEIINDGLDHICYGCLESTTDIHSTCERCKNFFCLDCDILIHSKFKVCPGCA
ncbi:unnamed protein product [Paramecium primaurelia]|uniref:VWFA domain-containing protein n=1 Tax=Paramecium primaurelia TaxID=5886 RepID=A0A8S1NES4_PARPR|nr:unnamed protein product [Paramecium primaurelia]